MELCGASVPFALLSTSGQAAERSQSALLAMPKTDPATPDARSIASHAGATVTGETISTASSTASWAP